LFACNNNVLALLALSIAFLRHRYGNWTRAPLLSLFHSSLSHELQGVSARGRYRPQHGIPASHTAPVTSSRSAARAASRAEHQVATCHRRPSFHVLTNSWAYTTQQANPINKPTSQVKKVKNNRNTHHGTRYNRYYSKGT